MYHCLACKKMQSQHRNRARRTVSSETCQELLLQRRKNNRGAAKKARERKRIYMELLEHAVQKLNKINQEGKKLVKVSNKLVEELSLEKEQKVDDEIGKYLQQQSMIENKKQISLATMDLQRQCKLNKISCEIEQTIFPFSLSHKDLQLPTDSAQASAKIKQINQELPWIFNELKASCSDHASLHVLCTKNNKKSDTTQEFGLSGDPYMGKTLMEQYYSNTMCKKNVENVQVQKYLRVLLQIDKHCIEVQKNVQQSA